jgi:hypothetical protein
MITQTKNGRVDRAAKQIIVAYTAFAIVACNDGSGSQSSEAGHWSGSITCGGSAAGVNYPDQAMAIDVVVEQTQQRLFLRGVALGIASLSCNEVTLSATPDSNDNYFFVPTSCTAMGGENVMLSTLSPARFIDNRLDFAVSLDRADRDTDYAECTAMLTSP